MAEQAEAITWTIDDILYMIEDNIARFFSNIHFLNIKSNCDDTGNAKGYEIPIDSNSWNIVFFQINLPCGNLLVFAQSINQV